MVKSASGEQRKVDRRKAKIITIVTALATAATPGIYSAWQTAKNSYQQRVEQTTRDTQETDLQKNVIATQAEVAALSKSCVTHKDLVDLVIKLRESRPRRIRVRTRRSDRRPRAEFSNPKEVALLTKLDSMKAKAAEAKQARKKADVVSKSTPKLRPVSVTRKNVQRRMEEQTR